MASATNFQAIQGVTAKVRSVNAKFRQDHPQLAAEMDAANEARARLAEYGLEDALPLERLDLARFAAEGVPRVSYLRDQWLAENDVALWAMRPGEGKTTLALSLAYAIASGMPFLAAPSAEPRPVVYLDGEAGSVELQSHALTIGPPNPNLHLISHPGIAITRPEDAASVERELVIRKPALLVLDTVSSTFGLKDENDAAHVGRAFAVINRWRDRHRCAVLLLHHLNKSSGEGGGRSHMDRVRGSSAFAALCSFVLYGEKTPDGSCLEVSCPGKARGRTGKFAARVSLVASEPYVTLQSEGVAPPTQSVVETVSSQIQERFGGQRVKRSAIVTAFQGVWPADTVDRALCFLKENREADNARQGHWNISARPVAS